MPTEVIFVIVCVCVCVCVCVAGEVSSVGVKFGESSIGGALGIILFLIKKSPEKGGQLTTNLI